MANNSTAASNVIPFVFEANSVRVQEIGGAPWFGASDVCAILGYRNAADAVAKHCRAAGIAKRDISSGGQMRSFSFINEGNLYRLIIKSRKEEAQRFEAWVCDEVLPAIRKQGRYEEPAGKMAGLMNDLMLTPAHQRHVLDRVAELAGRDKKKYPTVWRSIKAHFKVASYKQIPDSQYPALCEFMMCKPIGGEYLPKQEEGAFQITEKQAMDLSHLLHAVAWLGHRWSQGIGKGLQYLNRDLYAGTFEHVDSMRRSAGSLDDSLKDLLQEIDLRYKLGGRRPDLQMGRSAA